MQAKYNPCDRLHAHRRLLLVFLLLLVAVTVCACSTNTDGLNPKLKDPKLIKKSLLEKKAFFETASIEQSRQYLQALMTQINPSLEKEITDAMAQEFKIQSLRQIEQANILDTDPKTWNIEFTTAFHTHAATIKTGSIDAPVIVTLYLVQGEWK